MTDEDALKVLRDFAFDVMDWAAIITPKDPHPVLTAMEHFGKWHNNTSPWWFVFRDGTLLQGESNKHLAWLILDKVGGVGLAHSR